MLRAWYFSHFVRKVRPRAYCLSVGNLSFGGTGKTPIVCALADSFSKQGFRVAVISRSYRGSQVTPALVPAENPDPKTFGDEPVMLKLQIPNIDVYVAKKKWQAIEFAEQNQEYDILILDDGFQHWWVERDFDLVLIDATVPFRKFRRFPLGMFRESVSALKRAHQVLLTKTRDQGQNLDKYLEVLPQSVLKIDFDLVVRNGNFIEDQKVYAFCAIGNPKNFYHNLRQKFEVVGSTSFRDHHHYSNADISKLNEQAGSAQFFATTSKDAVKITKGQLALPLIVLDQTIAKDSMPGFCDLIDRISSGVRSRMSLSTFR